MRARRDSRAGDAERRREVTAEDREFQPGERILLTHDSCDDYGIIGLYRVLLRCKLLEVLARVDNARVTEAIRILKEAIESGLIEQVLYSEISVDLDRTD